MSLLTSIKNRIFPESFIPTVLLSSLFSSFMYEIYLHNGLARNRNSQDKQPNSTRSDSGSSFLSDEERILQGLDSGDDIIAKNVETFAKSKTRFKYFLRCVLGIQLGFTLKEILTSSLDYLPETSPYRLIDCYLVGRLTLTGTFTQVSHRFSIMITGLQFLWIIFILVYSPAIRFCCIDFLLHTCEQVKAIEFKITLDSPKTNLESSLNSDPRPGLVDLLTTQTKPDLTSKYELNDKLNLNWADDINIGRRRSTSLQPEGAIQFELFQYTDQFINAIPNVGSKTTVMVRKNRTIAAWKRLSDYTQNYFITSFIMVVIGSLPVTYLIASVIFTRQGFELNYSVCTNYIKLLDEKEQLNYKHIYDLNMQSRQKPLRALLDMVDLISFTSYDVIRVLADIMQTSMELGLSTMSFTFDTFISILIVRDVIIYIDGLQAELSILVMNLNKCRKLPFKTSQALDPRYQHLESESWALVEHGQNKLNLSKQVYCLQAQLVDFFMIIGRYNIYNAVFTSIVLAAWLLYSFLAANYLLAPNGIVYYEIIFGQFIATGYFICVIGSFALVTHKVRKLYHLITSAMALDEDFAESKQRWATILTYFHPKPLYCFTLFGFAISWQFCLQVSD